MIRLTGPEYVSLYAMARVFDVTHMQAGRLRVNGCVRGYEVAPRVWRIPLRDVERVANECPWYGARVRRQLAGFPRDHFGYIYGGGHAG